MTDERWKEILGRVKDSFEVTEERTEDLQEDSGLGTVEVIEFKGPLGRMKLERTTQPLIIDKKTMGSRRIGSETAVQYVYSETEKVHKFKAYRFDESNQNWIEMTMERGDMIF